VSAFGQAGTRHLQPQNPRMGIEISLAMVEENRTPSPLGESRGTSPQSSACFFRNSDKFRGGKWSRHDVLD
jgi:hypothetical protein